MKPASEALKKVISDRRRSQSQSFGFDRIVHRGDSPLVGPITLARRAARYDVSVLITGASGTGKELLARAIHQESARAEKSFVVENCGALPDDLLESELFGCKKGAYTGAYQDRIGLFELADSGTIFLDEIGENLARLPGQAAARIAGGRDPPLGALRPRKVNVRVISATNRNLLAEVAAGRFRRDLITGSRPFRSTCRRSRTGWRTFPRSQRGSLPRSTSRSTGKSPASTPGHSTS
ncbi:sigma-54 factor interaction domain-containing protein [Rhizobium leguminosarum]|uniref:sigma-54 factor interaction domain-containing protein n=1 Tax=Rhizobium leguminosarum TaxID=384 RepID=UPI0028F43117|nr:sigma-54 factor interaction domain-containing protein [Rhizobium leguminosarum]